MERQKIMKTEHFLKVVRITLLSSMSIVILQLIEKEVYTLNYHFDRVSVRLKNSIPSKHYPIYKPIWPGKIFQNRRLVVSQPCVDTALIL